MAKSNCPAEDSAPPQASAGQLTPCFLPLSLSGRLLQVTVAISPFAAKGASKGTVFCAHPDGRSPQANAGFRNGGKGSLSGEAEIKTKRQFRLDFRERVSRSIWPSKLVLSCYRILPAKWILSFAEEVSLALCVSDGWEGGLFCRESSLLVTFLNAEYVPDTCASLFSSV